jgi:segregation and condensation protein B
MQEQTTIQKSELTIPSTLKALMEALIFAAQEPLSITQIKAVYQGDFLRNDSSRQVELETIRQIVADLNKEYEKADRPYRIVQIAGGYQFATLSVYAEWLGKLYKEQGRRKLSQSGIETLAIVAYKQPITKTEVENIRGVNCDYVLKTLLEKELVTVTGRAESVGRPLLYGTTKEFLKHFGLNDITDLPRPREIEEILGESQFETERRMLEAQAGAEKLKREQEDFKSRLPHIPKKKSELEEKGVEIIQHRRTREIRIVPAEDRKNLEEAGQEKMEFPGESISSPEQPLVDINISESISSKPTINTFKENTIQSSEQTLEVQQDKNAIEVEKSSEIPITITENENGEIISSTEEFIELPQQNTIAPENPQQPKRWQVWKEKIRGFIKKLFV